MKIIIISIIPEIIESYVNYGVIKKAIDRKIIDIEVINVRHFSEDSYIDDKPYGGGAGMIIKVEPLVKATRFAKNKLNNPKCIYMSPKGKTLDQSLAKHFKSLKNDLVIVVGRYQGVDQRFIDLEVDQEISVGDYILSGGEVAACILIDTITRLIPGTLGDSESLSNETFENERMEAPQYSRPEDFEGKKVPNVLLSGNHQKIAEWRESMSKYIDKKKEN